MAIAVTCFGKVPCDGDPVRRVAVSLLEPAFVGVGLLARISAPLVILFNWAFGAIILLAPMQLLLDAGTLIAMLIHGGGVSVPDGIRYGLGTVAATLAAVGVHQALRVPPLKDIEIGIRGLAPQFDGYTLLQLTDLHISRLFTAKWARAVVERVNGLGANLIVVTGDLIDGSLALRRADVEPLRDLRAADGVYVIPGNHEYFFSYRAWMAHYAEMGMRVLENDHVYLIAAAASWFSPASPICRRRIPGIPRETSLPP
jgi:uncharacterized protein